jgi:3-phosphoshikimate 1-carboxyvinyltransferase
LNTLFAFVALGFVVNLAVMDITLQSAKRIKGRIQLPGDKSISHRLAMLGAIAEGSTLIENFASSRDCYSTLACLRSLGVRVDPADRDRFLVHGKGLHGLEPSREMLDSGNSGSTIRMISGILAGQPFKTRISGDSSLQRRPMKRIITPLTEMGASIEAREGNFPPLMIQGGPLRPIRYDLPVASAQVKSAVLLAGLYAEGTTEVLEPAPTRNHTELALQSFGVNVRVSNNRIAICGGQELRGIRVRVPGDISSAAFFIVAATVLAGSDLIIEGVGLNPCRRGIIDWLKKAGADIQTLEQGIQGGEIVGSLRVRSSEIRGARIDGALVPQVIDEIPILAVLATQTREGVEIRDAVELRVKESDRIQSTVENLRSMGAAVEEYSDGMFVAGRQSLRGSRIKPYGDHRIAMAFAVAALMAQGESVVEESECSAVSFPGFFEVLEQMVVR